MAYQTIKLEEAGSVLHLVLARPKAYNSFDPDMRRELADALKAIAKMEQVRVVILEGEGPGFSAGADLRENFPVPISGQLLGEYKPILEDLRALPQLTIAKIHGRAAGIGAAFALATDFMVMAEDASLYMAFAAIGLVPDGGLIWHLTNQIGPRKALEYIIEGKEMGSEFCKAQGLVNHVVDPKDLNAFCADWAASLASVAPIPARLVKSLVQENGKRDLAGTIEAEAYAQDICQVSNDHARARAAFLKKERPQFKGD